MYIFVVKELLKLIWFSIIKKLLPMSQNTCYLSPQSIHPLRKGENCVVLPFSKGELEGISTLLRMGLYFRILV